SPQITRTVPVYFPPQTGIPDTTSASAGGTVPSSSCNPQATASLILRAADGRPRRSGGGDGEPPRTAGPGCTLTHFCSARRLSTRVRKSAATAPERAFLN